MIDMRIRNMFFDRPKVQRDVDRGRRKALSRAGAIVRQTAKHSIRKRVGPAPAGHPPHSHEGSLRRHIYFAYDSYNESVVIGPAKLLKVGDAPHTMEFGGVTTAKTDRLVAVGDVGRDVKGRFTKGRRQLIKKGTVVVTRPRPYMGPALEKERPNIPNAFRGCVNDG